jgi:hypothetical protein
MPGTAAVTPETTAEFVQLIEKHGAVQAFAILGRMSYRNAARVVRAIQFAGDKLGPELSITKADKIIREALHGDTEVTRRVRRVQRDMRWLEEQGLEPYDLLYMVSPGVERTCPTCGNTFGAPRADGRYCSNACRQKAYRTRLRRDMNQRRRTAND